MKIVSFNMNSIRARPHQLIHLRDTLDPDIIGIQETKVNDPEFPIDEIKEIGYHPEFWGQKGHYGVAILSKKKPIEVQKGFVKDTAEDQKRFIQAKFKWGKQSITIMNGYFPQGENRSHETKFPKKIKYYADLKKHIKKTQKTENNLIVMGDFNVAPSPLDIGIGEINMKRWLKEGKTAFLPEEIDMWNSIKDLGFIDSWREQNPDEGSIYSWFDYRSRMFDDTPKRGLRIDHIMISQNLIPAMKETGIDYEARAMEKPSDHCPIWISLK
ncbi:exodeoxyribonuclease III [Gammaproteobacteria bacterium]|nr:exodeoxyribonuclease III [Gammaproteobacteria bacterium]MDA9142044.1 exodeoxyribonuclease III [Gammaproteobacteria bacterium]